MIGVVFLLLLGILMNTQSHLIPELSAQSVEKSSSVSSACFGAAGLYTLFGMLASLRVKWLQRKATENLRRAFPPTTEVEQGDAINSTRTTTRSEGVVQMTTFSKRVNPIVNLLADNLDTQRKTESHAVERKIQEQFREDDI
eukprot:g5351.t1